MGKQPIFTYNEETGTTGCMIYLDDFLQGYGIAECHPQDKDVQSERTGTHIAELRAKINLLQHYKNYELRPGLKALLHLKSTMINSSKYNPDSYESKRLNVEIKNCQKDIVDIQKSIEITKQLLYDYINLKEEIAARHRNNELQGYSDEDGEILEKHITFYERVTGIDTPT